MRLLVLLCLLIIVSHVSYAHASVTLKITATQTGQGNVVLTYTAQDYDILYANYLSMGETLFKTSIVTAASQLGFQVPVQTIYIGITQITKTMVITGTIASFARQIDPPNWLIDGSPAKSVYTSWFQADKTFHFSAPTKPQLPFPESFDIQLPDNAVNIQFNPNTYVLTYQLSTTPPPRQGCLIATALYGSPLEPEVQFLRHFRDETLVKIAGRPFVNDLNAWYYSFSPQVAEYIQENSWIRMPMILLISPVVSFIHVADAIIELLID